MNKGGNMLVTKEAAFLKSGLFYNSSTILIICAILFLYTECTQRQNEIKIHLHQSKEITFDLPLSPLPFNSGTYLDKKGKTIFYFVQVHTKKFVAFCDSSGKVLHVTPLQKALARLGEINSVVVFGMDTVIAMSLASNAKCNIDSTGNIYNYAELNIENSGHRAILDPTCATMSRLDGAVYVFDFIDPNSFDNPNDGYGLLLNKLEIQGSPIIRIENLQGNIPTTRNLLTGLQMRYKPKAIVSDNLAMTQYTTDGLHLYYYSGFEDSLYKINIKYDSITEVRMLASPSTNVGIRRPESIGSSDKIGVQYPTKPIAVRMIYDEFRRILYIAVFKEVSGISEENEQRDHRAWTLFIYDTSLNKLGEFPFAKESFAPKTMFCSQEGLWIKKYTENAHDTRYQLFIIEE